MNTFIAVLFMLIAALGFAHTVAAPGMRRFAVLLNLTSFVALLTVLGFVNDWLPFSSGGDDYSYFHFASVADNWPDALSPDLFSRYYAQPGFAMVLNAYNLVFEPGLFGFKVLNLTFFLILMQVWTRTFAEIEGVESARKFALCCVVLTPLWFYFFFLLKDMLIALLFATFVMGAVSSWKKPTALKGWALQLMAVLALIPFRAPLTVQALAVMIIAITARNLGKGEGRGKITFLVLGGCVLAAIYAMSTQSDLFDVFGVVNDGRVLGTDKMTDRASALLQESSVNRVLFPVIYLFTEISTFNAAAWRVLDATWVRGILAVPWILLGIPALMLGFVGLLKQPTQQGRADRSSFRFRESRMVSSPWAVVVAFIVISMMTSWIVGDTTRWRLSDMPALLAVAVSATSSFSKRRIFALTALWILCLGTAFALVALLRIT